MKQEIMDEDEYYASDEHLETEESYSDYLKGMKEKKRKKRKKRKNSPSNFGGVFE